MTLASSISPLALVELPFCHHQINHAHPQVLRVGEKVHLFQPPEDPGGTWAEMQAVVWIIEQIPDGQVSHFAMFVAIVRGGLRFLRLASMIDACRGNALLHLPLYNMKTTRASCTP